MNFKEEKQFMNITIIENIIQRPAKGYKIQFINRFFEDEFSSQDFSLIKE